MILRLRILIVASTLILSFLSASAQKLKKTDKTTLANLETHIRFLSDDKLEGRRTGTPGERLASDYISSAFSQAGLQPKGDHNGWLQAFEINEGRQISPESYFSVNDRLFVLNKDYFPLTISAVGSVTGSPAIALQEKGVPWFLDLKEMLDGNPAKADLSASIRTRAKEYAKRGATALILYNSSSKLADNLSYDSRERPEAASIPILYITREAKRKYLKDESASIDIKLNVGFTEKRRTGHNVVGYLDNGAANTIIIGAYYDYGNYDRDSLYHRSDDNASGVAAAIELARMLKEARIRGNNYLFVAFSGKEQDFYGSRYLVEHTPVDLSRVNYMINMDRVGWLSNGSHLLTIGGYGTSSAWAGVCNRVVDKKALALQVDSSSVGPGDHESFYHKKVPAMVFYTTAGTHSEPGQPDNDKINYEGELQVLKFVISVVQATNDMGQAAFTR